MFSKCSESRHGASGLLCRHGERLGLEEDLDARTFLDAYKARFGREAEIIDGLGSCRSWAPFGPRRLDEAQAQAIEAKRTGEAK